MSTGYKVLAVALRLQGPRRRDLVASKVQRDPNSENNHSNPALLNLYC